MESIFLAVVTDDREYGRALSLAILSVCRSFIIKRFDAETFFTQNESFDLILWDGKEAESAYGGKIVYLAEKPSDAGITSQRRFCIYKYSTAAYMVAFLFETYESLTGRRIVNLKQQNVQIFGIVSPTGGTGCTTLAMALSQELCRFQGKRILYLSFEEIESAGNFIRYDMGIKGAGLYLYHLFKSSFIQRTGKGQKVQSQPFLDGHMIRDDFGVETFAPAQGRNPLRELNDEELHTFIAALIDSGRYDAIVMDLGNWLSELAIICMKMTEKLCFVTSEKDGGVRERAYIGYLKGSCGEKILEKMIKVINMAENRAAAEEGKAPIADGPSSCFRISKCNAVIREGSVKKLLLEGDFGDGINKLAKQMIEPV